ncbi:hypothetical protein BX600DRAFT_454113 [Xylariales sp. PMI_506]|nr:hypothetical protein BX600DRAFT_454113 [Xylariales sp. PMI_506]
MARLILPCSLTSLHSSLFSLPRVVSIFAGQLHCNTTALDVTGDWFRPRPALERGALLKPRTPCPAPEHRTGATRLPTTCCRCTSSLGGGGRRGFC